MFLQLYLTVLIVYIGSSLVGLSVVPFHLTLILPKSVPDNISQIYKILYTLADTLPIKIIPVHSGTACQKIDFEVIEGF